MKRLFCGAAIAAALLISASPSSAQVVNMVATLGGAEETTNTPGVLGLLTGAVGGPRPPPATFTSGRGGSRVRWSSTFRLRSAAGPATSR